MHQKKLNLKKALIISGAFFAASTLHAADYPKITFCSIAESDKDAVAQSGKDGSAYFNLSANLNDQDDKAYLSRDIGSHDTSSGQGVLLGRYDKIYTKVRVRHGKYGLISSTTPDNCVSEAQEGPTGEKYKVFATLRTQDEGGQNIVKILFSAKEGEKELAHDAFRDYQKCLYAFKSGLTRQAFFSTTEARCSR